MPILVLTCSLDTYHRLSCSWGVTPFYCEDCTTRENAFKKLSDFAIEKGFVGYGDLVVVAAGIPFGVAGTTNTMMVESIGDVLVRASKGVGKSVYGTVSMVLSPEEGDPYAARNRILVIPNCDERYLPYLQQAMGVIVANFEDDQASVDYAMEKAKEIGFSLIVGANEACSILHEGKLATMDPTAALVYKGVNKHAS